MMSRNSLKNLINKASSRIYDLVIKSDLKKADNLSSFYKNNIFLKREDQQKIHSFKIRGAYNKLLELDLKANDSIYAYSAGNHAQGVAMAGSHLNLETNIIMPKVTPEIKINNVKKFGANIIVDGNNLEESELICKKLIKKNNGVLIHPYNDINIIAGQGTIGKEILDEIYNIDYIFCPIGGGGLISGVSAYVKDMNPNIKIIGVETFDSNSMYLSMINNNLVKLKESGLFSEGTAVKAIGDINYEISKDFIDDVVLVDTDDICLAIKDIYDDTRTIVEPAGALSLAGLKKYLIKYKLEDKNLVSIISGANMDFNKLRFISDRTGIKSDKEVMLNISTPEKPGSFLEMYNQIYPRNVLEFSYRYSASNEANIIVTLNINKLNDLDNVIQDLECNIKDCKVININNNELAKSHLRYFSLSKKHELNYDYIEKIYRFEFPEKPGALKLFLENLQTGWNISMFHYRNYGDNTGRVLTAIQIPKKDHHKLDSFLNKLNYPYVCENENPLVNKFI